MEIDMRLRREIIKSNLDSQKDLLQDLEESMETSNQLTEQMSNILSSFSQRLKRTEQAIIPIHQQSSGLQTIQQNISKTIGAFDNIIGYHHVTKEVEPTLNQGPSNQLDKYIQSLARTEKAVDFFNRTNRNSSELVRAKELIDIGTQHMEHHMISVLKRQSKVLNNDKFHDYLTIKQSETLPQALKLKLSNQMADIIPEDEPPEVPMRISKTKSKISSDKQQELLKELLPDVTISEISKVAEWLTDRARNQEYSTKYAKLRAEYVEKAISNYKKFVKKNNILKNNMLENVATPKNERRKSNNSHVSLSSLNSNELIINQGSTAINRRASNVNNLDYGQRKKTVRRNMDRLTQQVGASKFDKNKSTLVWNDNRSQISGLLSKSSHLQMNQEFVELLKLEYTITIEILNLEKMLVEKLIPSKNAVLIRQIFKDIAAPCFAELKINIDQLVRVCRDKVDRQEYKDSLLHLPLTEHIRIMKPAMNSLLQDCSTDLKNSVDDLYKELHKIGGRMLEEFVVMVKNHPDKDLSMPPDGTVHELTSKAMLMVSHLDQYHEATAIMAMSINSQQTFKTIVNDVIVALFTNLESKSKFYSKSSLQNLFLLNNFNYMSKACGKGSLPSVYPDGARMCTTRADQHRNSFVNSWSKLKILFTTVLKNGDDINQVTQLTDKHKQMLKEKFKSINATTEELAREQAKYAVPDPDMKTRIQLDLQNMLIPVYSEFYRKMKLKSFSSHQGKYMRIDPDTLSVKIEGLFGGVEY